MCEALFHQHHHLQDDHLHRHRRHLSLIERLESAGPDASWTMGLLMEARSEG